MAIKSNDATNNNIQVHKEQFQKQIQAQVNAALMSAFSNTNLEGIGIQGGNRHCQQCQSGNAKYAG